MSIYEYQHYVHSIYSKLRQQAHFKAVIQNYIKLVDYTCKVTDQVAWSQNSIHLHTYSFILKLYTSFIYKSELK